jgi:hypothetical protein
VYLVVLAVMLAALPAVGNILLALLAFYGLAVLAQAAALAARGQILRSIAAIPLIVLTHVLYGVGFWRGLFTKLKPTEKRAPVEVVLERVEVQ